MPTSITNSWWTLSKSLQAKFPKLTGNRKTDVLIIGGGITGLSTAIVLAGRGHKVIVCEAEAIGAGTTGASTGHLDAHPEMGPNELVHSLGIDDARTYTSLRQQAIETIAQRAGDYCQLVRLPAYYYSESVSDVDVMHAQCDAANRIGLQATFVDRLPIPQARVGYRIEQMGRIHCMKYLDRLTRIASELGVEIFEQTLVEGPIDEKPNELSAGEGKVTFKHVVCATHCSFTQGNLLYAATPPYQSYAIVVQLNEALEDALYWDNSEPYYYVRRVSVDDPKLLIVGGCDHRTGTSCASEALKEVETWTRERFDVLSVVHRWSAELFEPTDGLPMIGLGPGKENIWVATGLSGVGLTLGTVAAELIADGIEGRAVVLRDALSPSRIGLSSDWFREQAVATKNLSERVLPANSIDPHTLNNGDGKVGNYQGEFVGICRSAEGCLHSIRPVCPHMGGVLHWNDVEMTWDCPLHGGRFTAAGKRIYGPPEDNLEPVELGLPTNE